MEMIFRPLTMDDYAVAEAFKRATVVAAMGDDGLFDVWFPPERSFKLHLEKLLAFDAASCAQLMVDGVVVGDIHLMKINERQGLLNNIYLLPEWRGRGLGEVMDGYAMAFFRRHGLVDARLRTNPQQPKVVAFYERLGWRKVHDVPNDMIEMAKSVGAGD